MKLTKEQVTAMIQCMLDDSLKSNDERMNIVDGQSPLVETEDGWEVEFGCFLDAPSTFCSPIGMRTLKLHITAHQRIDSFDEEEDLVEGEWKIVKEEQKQKHVEPVRTSVKKTAEKYPLVKGDDGKWRMW